MTQEAKLYIRTLTTLSDTVNATTPTELETNFEAQVLTFLVPDNILEAVKFVYQNNISNIIAPNSEGVRRINKQENGLRGIQLTINGVFRNPKTISDDIAKLRTFMTIKQLDLKHVQGIVGFECPNAPEFNLDPNATTGALPAGKATQGYTIDSVSLGYVGQQPTRYDFQVVLSFGGTWTG